MKTRLWSIVAAGLVWGMGWDHAQAAATQFKVTSGNWNNAANWSAGLPSNNEADVGSSSANPATAAINVGDVLTSGVLVVGQFGGQTGTVNQNGGSLDLLTNYLKVASAGVGTYTLSGGTVSNATLYVATSSGGTGTVFLCGGSLYGSGGTPEAACVGRNANTFGRVVQTSGLFSINPATGDFTLGRDNGVGVYELSGGMVTNVKNLYLGMAATGGTHPVGTIILSGTGSLYGTSGLHLGYGAGGTGIVYQSGGYCQPGGLKIGDLTAGNRGVGQYEITGGQYIGSVDVGNGGVGTLLVASSAYMGNGWFNVGATWSTTGMVTQTGGVINPNANFVSIGAQTGGFGQYYMRGGALSNAATITIGSVGGVGLLSIGGTATVMVQTNTPSSNRDIVIASSSSSTGTLQVVGGTVSISSFNNLTMNQPGATLDMVFASEGIGVLRPGWGAYLAGSTLSMGLNGGIALFQTNSFLFLQSSSISGDFSNKLTSVFSITNISNKYSATLDANQRAAFSPSTLTRGQVASFTASSKGWFPVTVPITSSRPFGLDLAIYTNATTSLSQLDSLTNYLAASGCLVSKIADGWDTYNIRIVPPAPTPGASLNFAWDLSRFNTNLLVGGATMVTTHGTVIGIQ